MLLAALVLPLPIFSVRCIDPPVLESMKLKGVIKRHYYPGDRIDYECYRGYFYVLPYLLSATCEPNGSWSRIEEACLRKSCPDIKVKHGKVVAPNETFEWESEAHISCDEGYFLRGKPIIVCNLIGENVSWSDTIPHCEKIYCGQPPKIKHGKHTNSYRNIFEYNELITYSCDLSNGPDEYSLVGQSKLVCIEPNKWSSDPPLCKVVKCERPFLEHGIMVSGSREKFSYQSVVVFECLQGFYLNGSNLVFCGGNDTWEPEMPTCIKGYRPTHPTKTPLSQYPGYPNPVEEIPSLEDFEDLDAGIIALAILTAIVAVIVVCTCLYRCLFSGKKEEKDMKEKAKEIKEKEEREMREKEERKEKEEKEKEEKKEKERKEKEKEKKEKEKKEKKEKEMKEKEKEKKEKEKEKKEKEFHFECRGRPENSRKTVRPPRQRACQGAGSEDAGGGRKPKHTALQAEKASQNAELPTSYTKTYQVRDLAQSFYSKLVKDSTSLLFIEIDRPLVPQLEILCQCNRREAAGAFSPMHSPLIRFQ
ncbi:membrane cofactor protein-like [Cervus elaphus]|uniref:membrane cofactor protein-like n=1 Tax=Cervus elaphus TaxID=9860 RepID=UPI001CC2E7E0|nr:membrane cofactor protein-like [Cervus elaphus]